MKPYSQHIQTHVVKLNSQIFVRLSIKLMRSLANLDHSCARWRAISTPFSRLYNTSSSTYLVSPVETWSLTLPFTNTGRSDMQSRDWNANQTLHVTSYHHITATTITYGCIGGAAVRRQTRHRKVAGSTPRRGTIKSTRSTQPSIPPG